MNLEDSLEKSNSSEGWSKRVFKSIPNPIFIYKKLEDDLILIDYNKAAEDMTEGKIKNIIGVKAKDFHKENPEILEDLNRCIGDKVKISRELKYRLKTTDKEKILNVIYISIPPDIVLVHTEDIGEKRKIEEDLKKSEREKSIIFENIHEHVVFQDINHRVIWCNKAACESVNSSLEQLIGRTCFEIWQNQDVVCEKCPVDIALKTGRQERGEAITPDGRVWNIRGNPVRNNEGNIVGAVELTTEITEQKRAEQKLKESEVKYREAYNRSDLYKDLFTHDINNILQNILTSVDLSKLYSSNMENKKELKEIWNLISEQIIRGKKLVLNVQKLSEVEEVETPIESTEALSILSKAIEFVKESFPYKVINIEKESPESHYLVNANELLINIFENILFNGIKHNTHNIIDIKIKISKERKYQTNYIKFEFLDNGVGIHDSMKAEIFSRKFHEYKKDTKPSGIGLGLLLINRILNSYNGEIRVEDRVEGDYSKGSNFIILIPEAI